MNIEVRSNGAIRVDGLTQTISESVYRKLASMSGITDGGNITVADGVCFAASGGRQELLRVTGSEVYAFGKRTTDASHIAQALCAFFSVIPEPE